MLAAILEAPGKMEVKEVPRPRVGKKEMLLRVRACAVCGSDIRIFRHGNPRVKPPQTIGHEIAGEVVEVGEGVEGFKVGERLAVGADVPCGRCWFCRNGHGNNCPENYAIGYQFPGGFAEYLLLNEMTVNFGPVHHVPEGLGLEVAALAEPLGCCLNGLECSMLSAGESVLIIGAGPAGCLLAEAAKALGARKVILAQRSRPRLEMARQFRADVFICTEEEDLRGRVLEETGGEGVDIAVIACASLQAQEEAIGLVRNRGRVNCFGGLPAGSARARLDSNLIHYKELHVHGSHGSVPRHHHIALGMLASGAVRAEGLITHHFPLSQVAQAFSAAESREGMKVIVHP